MGKYSPSVGGHTVLLPLGTYSPISGWGNTVLQFWDIQSYFSWSSVGGDTVLLPLGD